MASWYLVFCAIIYSMDARPVQLESSTTLINTAPADPTDEDGGFWTRWNSDAEDISRLDSEQPSTLFTKEEGLDFASKAHRDKIVSLSSGCGRGKNRLATLSDGTKMCCRYRQWQDIRGEFYAYHLNNFLGLFNAPPATLIKVNFSSPQWEGIVKPAKEAGWDDHTTIVVSLYVEDLADETLPSALTKTDSVVSEEYVEGISSAEKSRILQWSDLLVFDFVMGHSDRVFNNLFNLQWNSQMLERPVHNLLKTKHEKKLLLFDNESGFWLGYKMAWSEHFKYDLQKKYLEKMCVFRTRTIESVKYLLYGNAIDSEGIMADSESESPTKRLENYINKMDSKSFHMVEPLKAEQRSEFKSRLRLVLEQVAKCEAP